MNSNTDAAVTDRLAEQARSVDGELEFICVTAPFGARYVEGRAEAAIAAHATLVAIAKAVRASASPIDACIIACFGEPGLAAARELFAFPIVGIAEASMLTAVQLASKFAILTRSARWPAMLWELATLYGQNTRCAGIYSLAEIGIDFRQSHEELSRAVLASVERVVAQTDVGCVILGGAALTGLAPALQNHLGVPIIDGLTAAVAQARVLSKLGPAKPSRGTYARPGKRALIGVDADLRYFFEQ